MKNIKRRGFLKAMFASGTATVAAPVIAKAVDTDTAKTPQPLPPIVIAPRDPNKGVFLQTIRPNKRGGISMTTVELSQQEIEALSDDPLEVLGKL